MYFVHFSLEWRLRDELSLQLENRMYFQITWIYSASMWTETIWENFCNIIIISIYSENVMPLKLSFQIN
jgi:hypothetical protein